MNTIQDRIAQLETEFAERIAELRKIEAQGYTSETAVHEDYAIDAKHKVVYKSDDSMAGIIICEETMKKYMESLK